MNPVPDPAPGDDPAAPDITTFPMADNSAVSNPTAIAVDKTFAETPISPAPEKDPLNDKIPELGMSVAIPDPIPMLGLTVVMLAINKAWEKPIAKAFTKDNANTPTSDAPENDAEKAPCNTGTDKLTPNPIPVPAPSIPTSAVITDIPDVAYREKPFAIAPAKTGTFVPSNEFEFMLDTNKFVSVNGSSMSTRC